MNASPRPVRAALAARVSTRDKNQDPELQLVPMRELAAARGWTVVAEYVDVASASDFTRRTEWRCLLSDARRRRVDLVAVWKLDRAFRSAIECLNTLADWQARGVDFVCVSQPEIDTTTPIGKLLVTVLAAVAEFERDLIRERVTEGMANARRKGVRIGRPPALERPGFAERWAVVRSQLLAGEIGKRAAARQLAIGAGTLARLIEASDPPARPGPRLSTGLFRSDCTGSSCIPVGIGSEPSDQLCASPCEGLGPAGGMTPLQNRCLIATWCDLRADEKTTA